jgi:hypothetical protein
MNLHHSETSDERSLWSYSSLLTARRETSLVLRAGFMCAKRVVEERAW